ncbi:MAG TPA: adenylate/guanylate cyclase domain-containing protein [Ignavibacteria bacterium]|nr:adenylate/guanylate cyclase domain-containing protein [Ignavibacteria bacterium]HRF65769.1 adenylate/guanylate cyclase domain-containing protein [Ignavibacteria bacterium]HRJ03222.1 adenylate/guanylate cyclase domain-containing protein [Ignavibacteria bacterium]
MIRDNSFKKEFEFEKTLSEYKRVKIICYLLGFGMIISIANNYMDFLDLQRFFKYKSSGYAIILWVFFFLCYELIFLALLRRYIRNRISINEHLKLAHTLIEIVFPGILMFMLTIIEERAVYLDAPYFLTYFLLIAISSLQLNFRISFFLGVFAALQYSALTYYIYNYIIPSQDPGSHMPIASYYVRAVMMLFTGAAAGMIASEINKRVQNSFSQLMEKQKIISLFGQQVSREIVDELILRKDDPDIKRVSATIMFLDIRNFSSYAETKDPAEIIQFQNNIFDPLIEIITKHKGLVNQFLGDGFMASFGIPIATNDHSQNAFNAGLEIIHKIKVLAEVGVIPITRVGIGIHSGEVITGNIGNEIRKQYSIAGTTVITAARLEQLNKEYRTQFLVTREFLESINTNGQAVKSLGEISIKGFEKPMEVMCVKV